MSTRWTNIDVPLAVGLDTRSDPKLATKPVDLQNSVFDKTNQLTKRPGREPLSTNMYPSGSVDSAVQLASYGDELVLFGADGSVGSYSPTTSKWLEVAAAGEWCGWGTTVDKIYGGTQVNECDAAEVGNIRVVAWGERAPNAGDYSVLFSVFDATTGAAIAQSQTAATNDAGWPYVVAVGSVIHIYCVRSAGEIMLKRIDPADLSTTIAAAATVLVNDVELTNVPIGDRHGYVYDVVSRWDGTAVLLAYRRTSGTQCEWVLPSGALGNGSNGFADGDEIPSSDAADEYAVTVALSHDDDTVFVAWFADTDGIQFATSDDQFDFAGGLSGAPMNGMDPFGGIALSILTAHFAADDSTIEVIAQNGALPGIEWATIDAGDGSSDVEVLLYNAGLASHIFEQDSKLYFHAMGYGVSLAQGTFFLCDLDGNTLGRPVTSALEDQKDTITTVLSRPKLVSDFILWAAPHRNSADVDTNRGISQVVYEPDADHANSVTTFNGVLLTGGPQVWEYDGANIVELGFHLYPEAPGAVGVNAAGTLTAGQEYFYRIYLESTNRLGQRSQSAAIVSSVTPGMGNDSIQFTFQTHTLTQKENVKIVGYRKLVANEEYHRAFEIENDPDVATITFTDEMSEVLLATKELDYLSSGEEPNFPFHSSREVVGGPDRLWAINNENRKQVQHSKLINTVNSGAINFFSEFVVEFPEDIVSVRFHADRMYAFSDRSVYVVMGTGPDNLGTGEFGAPVSTTRSVGCIDPRSMVDCAVGFACLSSKGIYLVGRDGAERFLGSDVVLYDDQVLTAAVALQDVHQVRWLTSSGRTLVYDYEQNQWSTLPGITGVAACVHDGVFHHVTSGGQVYRETPGEFLDDEDAIEQSVTTPVVKSSGVQGWTRWRRIFILGEGLTNTHKIRVECRSSYSQGEWQVIATVPVTRFPTMKLRIPSGHTKAAGIQFRLTEIAGANPGEGYSLSAITLEVGIRPTGPTASKIADAV